MSSVYLFFMFYSLVLTIGLILLFIKVNRPPQEDPRLSKGLQLLQSKISILEDLSDRTDRQVQQIIALLEERARFMQGQILKAQETLSQIDQSMMKSLNVAKIFKDKIPHEEIIERQNSAKYILAAKMAHQGHSIDDILRSVDLPRAEIEFIAKVNKEELTFSEDHLPEWAQSSIVDLENNAAQTPTEAAVSQQKLINKVFEQAQSLDLSGHNSLRDNFKSTVKKLADEEKAIQEKAEAQQKRQEQAVRAARDAAREVASQLAQQTEETTYRAQDLIQKAAKASAPIIKKVQFPRITIDK